MKGGQVLSAVCALASVAAAAPQEIEKRSNTPQVTVSGNAFWANGKRFYIRGIDYQPGGASNPTDSIADTKTCLRDIPYFKALGINTIRIYSVDNTLNHDACMKALSDAGIYLALDVNNGLYSLNRADPKPSYNDVYLQSVFALIDQFAQYDNTLLFFSGNEVINTPGNTNTAPYIKAVTRDMKNYIKARKYRQIPVGYSAADITSNREQTAAYMNCGVDGMARSDFFAFNDYAWCGKSSLQESGWSTNVATYSNYSIPLFLSEFGCNEDPPRLFDEWSALMSPQMTGVYSGGLVYEYSEEPDNPNYGLVKIQSTRKVSPLPDFNMLKQKLAANPAPSGTGGYHANLQPAACPAYSNMWRVKGEGLPAMPVPAQKYFSNGAGKGPGLKGPGSQYAGTQSTGFVTVTRPGVTQAADPGSGNAAVSMHPADWPVMAIVSGFAVVMSTFLGASLL